MFRFSLSSKPYLIRLTDQPFGIFHDRVADRLEQRLVALQADQQSVMSDPSKVKLWIRLDGRKKLALSIPFAECTTFAITPLKWLRFLGFIIYGQQGHISMSMNGPELDYTTQIEARSYYFISDGPPRFVDVDALDNRTQSVSSLTTKRGDFRHALIQRDGTCVLTGDSPSFCDACYLIPHSKGNSYMSNLFNHRHEMYGLVDPLSDINDTRNGILLNTGLHRPLDLRYIAFLKTPNFALTVDDVPYHQPPNAGSPENRLTLQHFPIPLGDTNQWPLSIIVDLSYAVAALQAWGPKTFIQYVRANSRDAYYSDDMESDDGEGPSAGPSRGPTAQVPDLPTSRAKKTQAVNPADQGTSEDMDLYDVVLALWKRAAREAQNKRKVPGTDAADVANNKTKIQTWLQSMEESS